LDFFWAGALFVEEFPGVVPMAIEGFYVEGGLIKGFDTSGFA
jgi:hypothetical protein